mmetsp:Transcript_35067/g.89715  ORF Transcript_35067/g.89715 Transcript_35067/m.89715 type:complete len:551 (-) Transcript_35067:374-2026(-)|eukprot:jgi/Tetstr1/435195/TSEL_024115.t1
MALRLAGVAAGRGLAARLSAVTWGQLLEARAGAALLCSGGLRCKSALPEMGEAMAAAMRSMDEAVEKVQKVEIGAEGLASAYERQKRAEPSYEVNSFFDHCWDTTLKKLDGKLQAPREIVWLNGAPGAGKGVNTGFILDIRGLKRAVTMSELLDGYPEAKCLKDKGELVPDDVVIEALLYAILNPKDNDGIGLVVDGFPRSALQVECVMALFNKLKVMHDTFMDTDEKGCCRFPRPSFKVVVLYVDEKTSLDRQVYRATKALTHNARLHDAGGIGAAQEARSTDLDMAKAMRRYDTFKKNYGMVLKLKEFFPFSLIDAMGSLAECEAQIARELRYQSSLDLHEEVYRQVTPIPLVTEIVKEARMKLVNRLNKYGRYHMELFTEVVNVIHEEVLPLIKKCGQAGFTEYRTTASPFLESTMACEMLIDVLADRGYSCSHMVEERMIPYKIDFHTGDIKSEPHITHRFRITFQTINTRSMSSMRGTKSIGTGSHTIGTTVMPYGLDHSEKPGMSRERPRTRRLREKMSNPSALFNEKGDPDEEPPPSFSQITG